MATMVDSCIKQLPWEHTLQGRELHRAYGSREFLIISQDETIQGQDIAPRRHAELTSDDKRELERLDLPPDQWEDDASIMSARISKDSEYFMSGVIKSSPGEPLMAKYVIKQIEIIMNNTQKEGGKLHVYFLICEN